MNDEQIKKLAEYAEGFYINELGHDPVDDGLGSFVWGFVEGVIAHIEGKTP